MNSSLEVRRPAVFSDGEELIPANMDRFYRYTVVLEGGSREV